MHKIVLHLILILLTESAISQSLTTDSTFYALSEIRKNPLKVKVLYLKQQNLKRIPKEVFSCLYLEELSLENNDIGEIPTEIKYLQRLKSLNLKGNRISKVSNAIEKLPKLSYLNLSHNNLIELPAPILKLPYLEILDVHQNKLTSFKIPFNSTNLKVLNYSHNHLSNIKTFIIPPDIKLTHLYLRGNQLKEVPEDIIFTQSLQEIDFSNNQLELVDEDIYLISNLESLKLGKNRIKVLPELSKSSHLKYLDLSENPLMKFQIRNFNKIALIPTILFQRYLPHWEYEDED
ncbi:leucine-rich repeat protein [Emticicia sp. ODNR4P]|nr:leucine-rich repeat protein [Emticicia sp. ODNR4P]